MHINFLSDDNLTVNKAFWDLDLFCIFSKALSIL